MDSPRPGSCRPELALFAAEMSAADFEAAVGGVDGVCSGSALGGPATAGETFEDDAPVDVALAAAVTVPGVLRLFRYATNALRFVRVALTGGIPPALMASVGCCSKPVSAAGVALSVVKAGALLVPIPPAPWQDAQPSAW